MPMIATGSSAPIPRGLSLATAATSSVASAAR
jgi:hypothetical protein